MGKKSKISNKPLRKAALLSGSDVEIDFDNDESRLAEEDMDLLQKEDPVIKEENLCERDSDCAVSSVIKEENLCERDSDCAVSSICNEDQSAESLQRKALNDRLAKAGLSPLYMTRAESKAEFSKFAAEMSAFTKKMEQVGRISSAIGKLADRTNKRADARMMDLHGINMDEIGPSKDSGKKKRFNTSISSDSDSDISIPDPNDPKEQEIDRHIVRLGQEREKKNANKMKKLEEFERKQTAQASAAYNHADAAGGQQATAQASAAYNHADAAGGQQAKPHIQSASVAVAGGDGTTGDDRSLGNQVFSEVLRMKDAASCQFVASSGRADKVDILEILSARNYICSDGKVTIPDRGLKGSYIYNFEKGSVSSVQGIGQLLDKLGPWTRKSNGDLKAVATRSQKFGVRDDAPGYRFDKAGPLKLKIVHNRLPREERLHRKIAYIVNDKNELASNVILLYTLMENGITIPFDTANPRTNQGALQVVREVLENRTVVEARSQLNAMGMKIPRRTLYHLSSQSTNSVKVCGGPRPTVDLRKLEALALKYSDVSTTTYTNGSNKPCVRSICVIKEAIRVYLSGCPSANTLKKHHEYIKGLSSMSTSAQDSELDSLAKKCSKSCTLPGFGCTIYLDTTFNLSSLYVTVCYGMLDNFINRSSGKKKCIVLAFMLHSEKSKDSHEQFGKLFSVVAHSVDPLKRIPALIVDGEPALRSFMQGTVFSSCTVVGCDVHLRGIFEKHGCMAEADEATYRKLFGCTILTGGQRKWKRAALAVLSEEQFCERLDILLEEVDNKTRAWLLKNRRMLWAEHSLSYKLRGGLLMQYASNNALEGFNANLKKLIPAPVPGEQVVQILLKHNEETLEALRCAVEGCGDEVRVSDHRKEDAVSTFEWEASSVEEKVRILKKFGLRLKSTSKLPSWWPSFLKMEGDLLSDKDGVLEKLDVFSPAPDCFVVFSKNVESRSADVRFLDDGLKCESCKFAPFTVCRHALKVLLHVDDVLREAYVAKIESEWEKETSGQILRRSVKPTDGTKSNRKFSKASKRNHPRTLDCFSDESFYMTREESELSSDGLDDTADFAKKSPVQKRQRRRKAAAPAIRAKKSKTDFHEQEIESSSGPDESFDEIIESQYADLQLHRHIPAKTQKNKSVSASSSGRPLKPKRSFSPP